MANTSIYEDIAKRTGGDIYIGVVGPVRCGKSTFIKKFMDTLVIPNISGDYRKERALDELPQSAAGRTIMTTEPKFIPENAVEINLEGNVNLKVRMIDCVGYIVPSSIGYIEDEQPRMVMTPWFSEEIPFNMAAEIGTKKVISEHSTIGLVITTDGSIGDIPRQEYEEAEERVINELLQINKPFIVLLNCVEPDSASAVTLAASLSDKYSVPVLPVNCAEIEESEIRDIISQVLFEFPVKEISVDMPKWIASLPKEHTLRERVFSTVRECAKKVNTIRSVSDFANGIRQCDGVSESLVSGIDLGTGAAKVGVTFKSELFYRVLSEKTGMEISDEQELMDVLASLAEAKKEYERIKSAFEDVEATGYGIVMPTIDELKLEEPEIMRQGGKYGVRLRASAPSIHLMRADIVTEIAPLVGTESQSEDLIMYLLKEFEENPTDIWQSNIFGKSLHSLVSEGLNNKLSRMPNDARMKIRETIERVINEGCSGLICIIL